MTDQRRGLVAVCFASLIWSFSGILYKGLTHVPAFDVLAHRVIWSSLCYAVILMATGRLGRVGAALAGPLRWRILLASVVVSLNWLLFIVAVQSGHLLSSSLGYYIYPLLIVAMGVLFFGETFSRAQWIAVGAAACGVVVLALGLRIAPWISVMIATTFATYGLVKKTMPLDAMVSVMAEVVVLLPLALIWLVMASPSGSDPAMGFTSDLPTALLLLLSGPVTAAPLILFSYGAPRLKMSTLGLVQYINPTIQLAIAVLLFQEAFTFWHAVSFVLIWSGLALYSWDSLRSDRARVSLV